MVAEGKRSLNEAIRERMHVRHSGGNYEQFRREVRNGHLSRIREHPSEVAEARRQMECYRPVSSNRRKEDKGLQHLIDGGGGDQNRPARHFFKCDRVKPKCNGTRFCRFTKKEDGTAVNTQEVIAEKFRVTKE